MSAMRILIDTNVLIDLYEMRPPDGALSQKLLAMRMLGDAELWASAQSFADIFYIERKEYGAERIYKTFAESFEWLEICSVNAEDIHTATSSRWRDFEDCVIDQGAQKIGADFLLTRNKKDFAESNCVVLTPREFFDMLETEYDLTYDDVEFDFE